jgi:hypothetical protein
MQQSEQQTEASTVQQRIANEVNTREFYLDDFKIVGIPEVEQNRLADSAVDATKKLSENDIFEADMERLNEFFVITDKWTSFWGIAGAALGTCRNICIAGTAVSGILLTGQDILKIFGNENFSAIMISAAALLGAAAACFHQGANYFFNRRDRRKRINMRARKVRNNLSFVENGVNNNESP